RETLFAKARFIPTAELARDDALDQPGAETLPVRLGSRRTARFPPGEFQVPVRLLAPVNGDISALAAQGAIFDGIGRELVNKHGKRDRGPWRHGESGPVEADALRIENRDFLPDDLAEIGARPFLRTQEIMCL